ncbi:hypothetical protein COT75_01725 [Candidatus Beckwithbacteria bacterium CG10_big_fil_rev_8_21_14_0_10_34_10]|uniref:Amine oxidase domain-containing protein n=1 Tax=Candidatus Beckwithbacteria bacterium CG10_big_fil_rev_8_21_14_0_10_34_10 TaxID=1974495 RepID=A0A2H0W9R8_9BACT|nr:MAG: hypothetical protein COT75_01725 [Candidatus Beckwithbacteria bacterium CG10_big_fil_rev_8_21_14_0_10_34_10]
MKIAIVGAGITGLTAAYYLSKKGHKVYIFEKDKFAGGLASGFRAGDWYLERFYHHIFKDDKHIQQLTDDLGLNNIWLWKDCGAPIFYQGKMHPFSSPVDLLKFSPLSFINRIRTGLTSLYLLLNKDYRFFEGKKAAFWLKKYMGQESWKVIWRPLMIKKFGNFYSFISMTWMWARVNRRSRFLGYPKGGFQIIINKLVSEIKRNKGKIILNEEVKTLKELGSFDKTIFTGANPAFLKLASDLPEKYKNKLEKIEYFGTVLVLLTLKKPLSNWAYWMNINDNNIPFVGCVQHTNLVSKKYYKNLHPLYLVSYTSRKSKLFKQKDEEIFKKWVSYLKRINKDFNSSWIKNYQIIKEPFTQPIFKVDSYKDIPSFKTPIKNFYLANTSQIYPWDRAVNYAVGLGKRIAFSL